MGLKKVVIEHGQRASPFLFSHADMFPDNLTGRRFWSLVATWSLYYAGKDARSQHPARSQMAWIHIYYHDIEGKVARTSQPQPVKLRERVNGLSGCSTPRHVDASHVCTHGEGPNVGVDLLVSRSWRRLGPGSICVH